MGKILLIEDEHAILDGLEDLMNFFDHEVFVADHGRKGLNLAREHLPDLILIDIVMPAVSGYDVINQLKSDADLAQIPIVILSARTSPKDIEHGYQLGADEYITKPFDPSELLATVGRYMGSDML